MKGIGLRQLVCVGLLVAFGYTAYVSWHIEEGLEPWELDILMFEPRLFCQEEFLCLPFIDDWAEAELKSRPLEEHRRSYERWAPIPPSSYLVAAQGNGGMESPEYDPKMLARAKRMLEFYKKLGLLSKKVTMGSCSSMHSAMMFEDRQGARVLAEVFGVEGWPGDSEAESPFCRKELSAEEVEAFIK